MFRRLLRMSPSLQKQRRLFPFGRVTSLRGLGLGQKLPGLKTRPCLVTGRHAERLVAINLLSTRYLDTDANLPATAHSGRQDILRILPTYQGLSQSPIYQPSVVVDFDQLYKSLRLMSSLQS